jgi:hypothetical protein
MDVHSAGLVVTPALDHAGITSRAPTVSTPKIPTGLNLLLTALFCAVRSTIEQKIASNPDKRFISDQKRIRDSFAVDFELLSLVNTKPRFTGHRLDEGCAVMCIPDEFKPATWRGSTSDFALNQAEILSRRITKG